MKTRTVLFVLSVAAVLMMISAASNSDARVTAASRVMSGGQYVLAIQSTAVTQTAGYQLVDAAMSVSQRAVVGAGGDYQMLAPAQSADDGSGCCCKCRLPYIRKQ